MISSSSRHTRILTVPAVLVHLISDIYKKRNLDFHIINLNFPVKPDFHIVKGIHLKRSANFDIPHSPVIC